MKMILFLWQNCCVDHRYGLSKARGPLLGLTLPSVVSLVIKPKSQEFWVPCKQGEQQRSSQKQPAMFSIKPLRLDFCLRYIKGSRATGHEPGLKAGVLGEGRDKEEREHPNQ
ncbi:hypothetical protein AOLI_G00294590 [Acnodon oligacanthus]